jgi:hypothetical protein
MPVSRATWMKPSDEAAASRGMSISSSEPELASAPAARWACAAASERLTFREVVIATWYPRSRPGTPVAISSRSPVSLSLRWCRWRAATRHRLLDHTSPGKARSFSRRTGSLGLLGLSAIIAGRALGAWRTSAAKPVITSRATNACQSFRVVSGNSPGLLGGGGLPKGQTWSQVLDGASADAKMSGDRSL